jgi:outer membrane protein TolC
MNAVSYLAKGGAGTQQLSFTIPGTTRQIGGVTDDTEWTAALTASMPLYRGGARSADIDRTRSELERIDVNYDAALQRLQADILNNLAMFEASLTSIQFARDGAAASRNNLDLVADSYARGIVTIIDLLDAQVASLTAELASANAVYDFMHTYLDLQYSMGRFDLVLGPDERSAALELLRSRLL